MSDVLIVLGDRRRVSAAQATVEGGHARWTGGWTSPWPDSISPGQNPQAAGEWLKSQWSAAGLTARSVWVVMSRDDVVLRHLELPAAPDDELADLVRFQAAARSSIPIDQAALDFIPLPATPSRPGRDVLSATISTIVLENYRALLKAADRELGGVTFSSTALAEWTLRYSKRREAEGPRSDVSRSGAQAFMASLTRRGTPGHADLTIVIDGSKLELAVVAERQLVFGHAARLSAVVEGEGVVAVQAEANRTMVAAERLRPDLKLHHVWLVGGDAAAARSLQEHLGCPVEPVEPLKPTELGECPNALHAVPADAVLLTGAMLARTAGAAPNINFLRPRQPPPKRDPRKQKIAIGAAAALLGSFIIVGGAQWRLVSLDHQIDDLRNQELALNKVIQEGKNDLESAKVVNDWEIRNVPQLELLVELEGKLPGESERPYFEDYDFTSPSTGTTPPQIKTAGAAKSRDDVEAFKRSLDEKRYRVQPRPYGINRDDDYPVRFSVDMDVIPGAKRTPQAAAPKTDADESASE